MSEVFIRTPSTKAEWDAYYDLRWKILREPWNQPAEAIDEEERSSTHLMLTSENDLIVAVGRLHRVDQDTGQIRYMAVDTGCEHKGYGAKLLIGLEASALDQNMPTIRLHAREGAVGFYQHHGYSIIKESYLLFNKIQHYLMSKQLSTQATKSLENDG